MCCTPAAAQMALFTKYEKYAIKGSTEFSNRYECGGKSILLVLLSPPPPCISFSFTCTRTVHLYFTSVILVVLLTVKFYVAN